MKNNIWKNPLYLFKAEQDSPTKMPSLYLDQGILIRCVHSANPRFVRAVELCSFIQHVRRSLPYKQSITQARFEIGGQGTNDTTGNKMAGIVHS